MIPVCRLTIYKDVPYTFLFMNPYPHAERKRQRLG